MMDIQEIINEVLDRNGSTADVDRLDSACINRLISLCEQNGTDGAWGKQLLELAADMNDIDLEMETWS